MDLKCDFSNIIPNNLGLTYGCFVKSVHSQKKNHKALKLTGDHLPGKNNNDVECFSILNKTLIFFPPGLGEIFPQVKKIFISGCRLESITREDLAGFKKLIEINVSHNQFKSIPSDLFMDKPNLKSINFYNNDIEFVCSKLLEPLMNNDLLLVDFLGNRKINYCYKKDDSNTSLQQLTEIMDTKCTRPIEEEQLNRVIFNNGHARKLEMLWTTGLYSDFTIIAADGQTEFRVHKFVLGLQSSVFDEILEIKTENQLRGQLTINDFSSGAVEEFLRFFYIGRVQDESHAMELFSLAGKYKVAKLASMMEKVVLENVNETNAFEILSLGHLHSSNTLKDKAFEVIKKIFPGKQLEEGLKDKPEVLNEMLEASKSRKRKMDEVDEEFKLKKYNKKSA